MSDRMCFSDLSEQRADSRLLCFGILLNLGLVCNFSSRRWLQTGSLLLALHFIRTRFQWYHTHSNSRAISLASKAVLYKGLCLSSHQCLLMMHAAHIFNTDTLPSRCHSFSILTVQMSETISRSFLNLSLFLSPLLPFCGVCLAAGFCLFIVSRWQTQTSFVWLSSFPESFFFFFLLLWLERLSCFLSPVFMMGPFKRSNWKQLSIPVCAWENGRKCLSFWALSI